MPDTPRGDRAEEPPPRTGSAEEPPPRTGSAEEPPLHTGSAEGHPLHGQGPALAVVAAGGVLGALARWGVGLALPRAEGAFPWDAFAVNALGGLLIGVLVVEVAEHRRPHPLLGPFLVTGVLGGFTTFSTYAVDAQGLLAAGRVATAGAHLVGTLLAAVAATWAGLALARAVHR